MSKSLPISCFIIARNEGDRIARTIGSVAGWVDEIIVIDSGSSDDTVAVCERLGARVIFHAWPGYGLQKRFGEEQCRNNWLLNLDADEEVTPALASEIAALFSGDAPSLAGFHLKVRDLLPGEESLSHFSYTNLCLRLYDKRWARFSDSPVHDSVIVEEGGTQILEFPVLHRSFRSLAHMVEKINSYSSAQAAAMQHKKMLLPHLRLLIELPLAFVKIYCFRGYAMRGWRGFAYSVVYAFGRFLRVAKYLESSR
ncbi:MAG: glycosyltransferase family 2 protein [Alphaproteobacteria bacterium]|nr:glycosyltransferase family 2 protein [Alphaproteobacteria bacterium]